jgi:hypothetical protein
MSVDEQMVPYTGNLEIKQYIRGKLCPWGIKFLLCTLGGTVLNFEVYQGKNTQILEDFIKYGLGAGIVLQLVNAINPSPYTKVYCDNFFTSIELLLELKEKGVLCTGTIRADRIRSMQIETEKDLKRTGRAAFLK